MYSLKFIAEKKCERIWKYGECCGSSMAQTASWIPIRCWTIVNPFIINVNGNFIRAIAFLFFLKRNLIKVSTQRFLLTPFFCVDFFFVCFNFCFCFFFKLYFILFSFILLLYFICHIWVADNQFVYMQVLICLRQTYYFWSFLYHHGLFM